MGYIFTCQIKTDSYEEKEWYIMAIYFDDTDIVEISEHEGKQNGESMWKIEWSCWMPCGYYSKSDAVRGGNGENSVLPKVW